MGVNALKHVENIRMNRRDKHKQQNYNTRKVLRIINDHGVEMEIVTTSIKSQWYATVTIYQEDPPFKIIWLKN